VNALGGTVNRGLYNGNISVMVTDIKDLEGRIIGATSQKSDRLMAYRYDQLNRISRAYSYGTYTEAFGWVARSISTGQAVDASFVYDKNGNITSLKRYDQSGNLMDNLSYNYNKTSGWLTNNRLRSVSDAVVGSASATDIENGQILDNYTYDQIGNLISDAQEGISSISWSVYDKVKKVTKVGSNSDIEFVYDAAGQRISKKIRTNNSGGSYTPANDVTTYYIRDASGNIMAVYEESSGVPTLKELPIYGSDRVGILEPGASLPVVNHFKRITRRKNYELKDHLGNVRVVISDFKSGRDRTGDSKADFYLAKVTSFSDYGPFGELLEGRTWMANGYRYGFGGHEKDDEIKGAGNHLSFGDYGYDPRLGRRWNVDPMAIEMPGTSPYSYAYNNPILLKDPDGKLPILPFLIKAGAAGATDMLLQVGMNYLLDDDVETIGQAFEKVDWVDVSISAAQGALPWSVPGGKFGKAAAAATSDVLINAGKATLNGEDYSIENATADFFIGFFSQLGAEKAEELLSNKSVQEKLAAILPTEELGIIYERIDKTGKLKPYVGQAKSDSRYAARQKEHARANPDSRFEFKEIDKGKPGADLNKKEQKALDQRGGPTNKSNPNGGTSNKKNVIKKQ
jgi:RHS repeat-associated protein